MAAKRGRGGEAVWNDQPPAQPNRSLMDGIECLLEIVSIGRPVGTRELARRLGGEHTRINRLAGTLAYMGLAQRGLGGKYSPGPGIHVLAAMSLRASNVLSVALPHLEKLAEDTGLTVALGVLWRARVCYLYHGGSEGDSINAIAGHDAYAAERSNIGLMLMAWQDPDAVRDLFHRVVEREPDRRVDMDTLFETLRGVRERGYSDVEAGSLAVIVSDPPIAGLAVAGNIPRDEPLREKLVSRLTATSRAITGEMR